MHTSALLSLLSLSLVLASPDLSQQRRHHRDLVERQGQGRPNMNNTFSEPSSSASSTVTLPSPSPQASSSASSASSTTTSRLTTESSVPETASASATSAVASPLSTSAPAESPSSASSSAASSAAPTAESVSPTGGVSTISVPSSTAAITPSVITPTTVLRSSVTSITTATRTASSSSSATVAAADSATSSSGGLSKPAMIAIIVVAVIVGVAGIGFTLFRRWKLRPSNRFEKRLNAIDFAPKGGNHGDDFFEKAHNRSASASSAERHRKALMAEEFESGPALTAGIPEHDFTAASTYGMAGAGAGAGAAGYGAYHSDPFAHTQAYDYHNYGEATAEHGYPPQSYDQYGNPVAASYDHPTQDQEYAQGQGQGYADLQRGNSDGSAHQHSHPQAQRVTSPSAQVYHDDLTFPESGQYLGRPTGGADGPYAQAAQYRSY